MKLIFAAEDTIAGIICGLLLIGFTGTLFTLKLSDALYIIAFIIYSVFIVLDLFNEIRDLTTHFGFILFSLLHSLIDLVIALMFVSYFSKWPIPFITENLLGFITGSTIIYFGVFLVAGNIIWLCLYPFLD